MTTNYPTSLDTTTQLPNTTISDDLDTAGKEHDVIHANVNQAVIAVETKLGTGSSNAASASNGSLLHHTTGGATSWRKRLVAYVKSTASTTTGITTTETTINGSSTGAVTLTANHRYRIRWVALIRSSAADGAFAIRVKNGGTVLRQFNLDSAVANRYKTYDGELIYTPASTASHTITLTLQRTAGSGTFDILSGADYPIEVDIIDEGRS